MRNNDELHEPNTKITYDTQLEKGVKFEFGLFRKIAVILGMSDRSRRVKYDSASRK